MKRVLLVLLAALCLEARAAAPTAADLQRVLEAQLQNLKPTGMTQRTVLFEEVRPLKPSGSYYPFEVTATIHDYGPGYPANRFYGSTCVGRMEKWKFDLVPDAGRWIAQGRMTVTNNVCKDNPAAGASSQPLANYRGTHAPKGAATAPQPAGAAGNLHLGEYACYGTGSRLMAGMGFHLKPGGKYYDVDGKRGGSYDYDAGAGTIKFRGGFLDGQAAKNVGASGFQISSTVSCEPWR
jgi:hypothetical protein